MNCNLIRSRNKRTCWTRAESGLEIGSGSEAYFCSLRRAGQHKARVATLNIRLCVDFNSKFLGNIFKYQLTFFYRIGVFRKNIFPFPMLLLMILLFLIKFYCLLSCPCLQENYEFGNYQKQPKSHRDIRWKLQMEKSGDVRFLDKTYLIYIFILQLLIQILHKILAIFGRVF